MNCILRSFKLNSNHCFVINLLALYSREDKHPLAVKFTNKTGKKVQIFWIDKKGRRRRKGKLKDGQSKTIDTYETHVFMAVNKKLSREPLLINGSPVFYAFPHKHGGNHLEVEIKKPTGMMQGGVGGYSHIKKTGVLVGNFEKKLLRVTKILFYGCGLKFFPPLRYSNSYSFYPKRYRRGSRCGPSDSEHPKRY